MPKLSTIAALTIGLTVMASNALASDLSDRILAAASQECRSFENGSLSVDMDQAISRLDVTGDGSPDEIIDSHAFACSTAASLFCGTGGCGLTVIADGVQTEFLSKAFRVGQGENGPVLELAVHWSECDYASTCWQTLSWDGNEFESLGFHVEEVNMDAIVADSLWVLQDFGAGKVTIQFNTDGTLAGKGPCNSFHSAYEMTYPTVKVGPIAATRMACANLDDEGRFFAHLTAADTIIVEGDRLILAQPDGNTLTFSR